MFRINLFKGFLYPLSSLKRLIASWLVLPVSLAVLVPPILFGLGIFGTVRLSLGQGLGVTAAVIAVCIVVGALPFTALAGYMLRCRREVVEGNHALPPWNDFRGLMRDGGKMDTVGLVLGLPALAFVSGALASVAVPIKHLWSTHTWGAFLMALLGSSAGLMFLVVALAFWISVMLLMPMITLRLALGQTPWQAMSLGGILQYIRAGWFDYVLCCAACWGISLAFSAAQAACFPLIVIGFPVQVYLQLVWASLLGQYARAYRLCGD